MIRSSAILVFFLAVAATLGVAQSTPPTQQPPEQTPPSTQPANPPVSSPAIIGLPPQGPVKPGDTTAVSAQQPASDSKPASGKGGKKGVDPSAVPGKDPTAIGPPYVIGSEDVLFVRVWQSGEFTGQVVVGPDGMISLQLVGQVRASGLTTVQLEQVLAEKLKAYLVTPEVNVQVLAPRSRTYIILGDGVAHPGIYPLTRQMTVMEALIAGGSMSPFAKKTKIYVMRGGQKFKFNWNEVSKGKNLQQNIYIQNGDQIYVP